jgi:hypothetical protein
MKKDQNVRFIRKNGKIVPIRVKDAKKFDNSSKVKAINKKNGVKVTKGITKEEFSNVFKRRAAIDERHASSAEGLRNVGLTMAAGGGLLAGLTKGKKGLGFLGAGLFMGGLMQSQRSNLKAGARTARDIASGKKNVKGSFGGRSERYRKQAKMLRQYIEGSSV